jgi:HEAT repeat protein
MEVTSTHSSSYGTQAISELCQALESSDASVRMKVTEALGHLGTVETIPGLLKALEDERSRIRRFAAEALERLGSIEAIPGLLRIVD